MTVNDIINLLSSLDQQSLIQIRLALDNLLGIEDSVHTSSQRRLPEELYEQLYEMIGEELAKRRITIPPFKTFKKTELAKRFYHAVDEIEDLMSDLIPLPLIHRRPTLRIYVELIIQDREGIGIPVTLKTIIQGIPLIPALFERAFPGYLGAGIRPHQLESMPTGGKTYVWKKST